MEARHAVASTAISLALIAAAVASAIGLNSVIGEPTAAPSPSPSSREFCVIAADLKTAAEDSDTASDDLLPEVEFEVDGTQPSPEPSPDPSVDEATELAELRAGGEELREAMLDVAALSREAAQSAEDPVAAQAFVTLADAQEAFGDALGDAAATATSMEEFTETLFAIAFDPELSGILADGEAAAMTIEAYVQTECGLTLGLGNASGGTGSLAATDASAIGGEFAVYYVDWAEGDPQASVAAQEGVYVVSGGTIVSSSPGVTLTDQFANSPVDWCVEVTEDATGIVFSFSSTEALVEGGCAALNG